MKYFLTFLFSLVFVLNSCKDACKDVDCQHGTCTEGICTCEAGWEKDGTGSCTIQDKCYDVSCGPHGTCADGVCTCEAGWEKDGNGSCTVENKCYGVSCGPHGNCNDGKCVCNAGYEGDSCSIVSRLKFLNNGAFAFYNASETGTLTGKSSFIVTIAPDFDAVYKIAISNAWGSFRNDVEATVDGNTFSIASQQPDFDGYSIQGSGTISGNVITIVYSVSTPNGTDHLTGTWTKQ